MPTILLYRNQLLWYTTVATATGHASFTKASNATVIKGITAFREYTAIASTVTAANIIDISSLEGI